MPKGPGARGWEGAPFCLQDSVLKQAEQLPNWMQIGSVAEVRRSTQAFLLQGAMTVPVQNLQNGLVFNIFPVLVSFYSSFPCFGLVFNVFPVLVSLLIFSLFWFSFSASIQSQSLLLSCVRGDLDKSRSKC